MSENKATKAALKEAKDFISKKDFKSALRCCKKVLNVDRNNYMALIFCGLCLAELDQPDQALQAYKRATQNDPSQVTGWQGLASFYEKQMMTIKDVDTTSRLKVASELVTVYKELMSLTKDVDKYERLSEKSVDLQLQVLQDFDSAVATLKARTDFTKALDMPDKLRQAHAEVVRVLSCRQVSSDLSREHDLLLLDSLQQVITDGSSIQNLEHLKINIRLMYKLRRMQDVLECAVRLNEIFPENSYALEWICKVYLEWAAGGLNFTSKYFEDCPERYIKKLLSLNENSTLAQLALGACTWAKLKNPAEAKKIIMPVIEKTTNPNFFGVFILCRCLFETQEFSSCERLLALASTLLGKVKEEETKQVMKNRISSIHVRALYLKQDFVKAAQLLKENFSCDSEQEEEEAITLQAKISAHIGDELTLENLMKRFDIGHRASLVRAILMRHQGHTETALQLVSEFLKTSVSMERDEIFEAMVLRGELLWDAGRYHESFPIFLKAAQINPMHWRPFLFLGRYYNLSVDDESLKKRDIDKARKCFLKSFNLNPTSPEAGMLLSDILREQGKWSENENLLLSLVQQSPNSTWAFLRLGIHYLSVEDPGKAVSCLQSVTRSEPRNIDVWECLGDAYFARGSLSAALKTYEHVLSLLENSPSGSRDPNEAVHARLQASTIKLRLGMFQEAKKDLESILQINGSYVPALKCLGETLIEESRSFLSEFRNCKAVDNCQKAVRYLMRAIEISSPRELSCLWKLMADALSIVECLPEELATMTIPGKLLRRDVEQTVGKIDLLKGSELCYSRCVQLDAENCWRWYDLAMSYLKLGQAVRKSKGSDFEEYLKKSENCTRKAIALDTTKADFWNLYGVIAFHRDNHALSQHAFIKSVTLERNAVAWTNLGILYLVLGEHQLANKAFKESQNQNPSYLRGWVGQAILAEQSGYDSESMDLFRHATFLGNELESSFGYANWVCKTLAVMARNKNDQPDPKLSHQRYCIEKMFGISIGIDCMTRYFDRVRDDPCGLNMWATLLERENLLSSARSALEAALKLLPIDDQRSDEVRGNLGRVCFKLGDFESSVAAYKSVKKQDFQSQVGLALNYFKCGKFEEAYGAYKSSLELTADDAERSHILAAMATIAFKFQGPKVAKTLLFQSSQLKPSSMEGLLALCVLGIKESDASLIQAAMNELEKRIELTSGAEYRADVISVKALILVLQGKKAEARKLFLRFVHQWPESSKLWRALTLFFVFFGNIQASPNDANLVSRCAEIASGLDRQGSSAIEMACLYGVGKTLSGDKKSLKAAARVVHMYPGSPRAWSVLVCSAFATKTGLPDKTLKNLVDRCRHGAESELSTSKLSMWIENYHKVFSN